MNIFSYHLITFVSVCVWMGVVMVYCAYVHQTQGRHLSFPEVMKNP